MRQRYEAWATSPDDAVSVLAVAGGVPLEVRLSNAAMRLPADVLARSVLATAACAGRVAAAELHGDLAAEVGVEATRTLERVGLPAPDTGTTDGPSRPGAGGVDDEGDGGFGSVLWRVR